MALAGRRRTAVRFDEAGCGRDRTGFHVARRGRCRRGRVRAFPRFEFSIDLKRYPPDDEWGAYSDVGMVDCEATQACRSAHRLRCYIRLGDERAAWLETQGRSPRPADCAGRDAAPAPACLRAQAALSARRLEAAQKKARPDLTRTSGLQDDFAGFLGSAPGWMDIADRRLLDYRAALCGVQATGSPDPVGGPATAGRLRCAIRLNGQHAAHLADLSDLAH